MRKLVTNFTTFYVNFKKLIKHTESRFAMTVQFDYLLLLRRKCKKIIAYNNSVYHILELLLKPTLIRKLKL